MCGEGLSRLMLSVWNEILVGLQRTTGPNGGSPIVLLIAPPPLAKLGDFGEMFQGGLEKSQFFGRYYRRKAMELSCQFLDAGEFINCGDLIESNFEEKEHCKLGEAVALKITVISH